MPNGELNLERGTEELSFGMDQVAIIDYAGGTPSTTDAPVAARRGAQRRSA